jgi:hypothetical protein
VVGAAVVVREALDGPEEHRETLHGLRVGGVASCEVRQVIRHVGERDGFVSSCGAQAFDGFHQGRRTPGPVAGNPSQRFRGSGSGNLPRIESGAAAAVGREAPMNIGEIVREVEVLPAETVPIEREREAPVTEPVPALP